MTEVEAACYRIALMIAGLIAAALFIGYPLWQTIITPTRKADFCYITHTASSGMTPPYWEVWAHVPWGQDFLMTRTNKFDEAINVRDNLCRPIPAEDIPSQAPNLNQ